MPVFNSDLAFIYDVKSVLNRCISILLINFELIDHGSVSLVFISLKMVYIELLAVFVVCFVSVQTRCLAKLKLVYIEGGNYLVLNQGIVL